MVQGESVTDSNGKPVRDHVCVAAIATSIKCLEQMSWRGLRSSQTSKAGLSNRSMSLKAYLTAKQAFFLYILPATHGLIEMNGSFFTLCSCWAGLGGTSTTVLGH